MAVCAGYSKGRRGRKKKDDIYELQYVAIGVKEDVEELISNVSSLEKWQDFEVFAEVWREMGFSLIYMGRETIKEMRAFTHEIFSIVLQMVVSDTPNFKKRVLAFYTLYGLYFKQPSEPMFKIRITHTNWMTLVSLAAYAREEGNLDVYSCLLEMLESSAFAFVHYFEMMGPSRVNRKHWQQTPEIPFDENWLDISKSLCYEGVIQRAVAVDKAYMNVLQRSNVFNSLKKNSTREHVLADFSEAIKIFTKMTMTTATNEELNELEEKIQQENDSDDPESSKASIGSRRRELKAKQMGRTISTKSKRRCKKLLKQEDETETGDSDDYAESSDESDSESQSPPPRRMSERTNQRQLASLGIYYEGEKYDQNLDDGDYDKELLDSELFAEEDEYDKDFQLPSSKRRKRSKSETKSSESEGKAKRSQKASCGRKKRGTKTEKKRGRKKKVEEEESENDEESESVRKKMNQEFFSEVLRGPKLKHHTHIDSDEDLEDAEEE